MFIDCILKKNVYFCILLAHKHYYLHTKKMKEFTRNVFATVVGIFLTMLIMAILLVIQIVVLAARSSNTVEVENNSVLVLKLQGTIAEHAESNIFGLLTGGSVNQLGLDDILDAIDVAEKDDRIKGIYIEAGVLQSDYATLQEIRNRLVKFRASKKWIVAYGDQYIQASYYLASVADKVYVNPLGSVDWHGVASQTEYYKDFLAKFGIKMNVVKVGTYKSYTETYTEDHMSDANREQITTYINGIWDTVTTDVSKSRGVTVDNLKAYADSMLVLADAQQLKNLKLVDEIMYADAVKAEVKKRLGIDADEPIAQLTPDELSALKEEESKDGEKVAVYYCEGGIVMNEATEMFASGDGIVAANVCKDLKALEEDDDVKAVVIRVNSGGGDAYASEQLWRAVTTLKAKKPVVISMGGAAASGGYYMSCNASYIVAQPTTLTGSIGIFATLPDVSELVTEKLGIHFDEAKTNRNASFSLASFARPLTAEEMASLQAYVDRGYATFLSRVAGGRKKTTEQVNEIAQGRVWLGKDAIKLGLVDELGGIDVAIRKAAQLAKIKEYHTVKYPETPDFMTQLFGAVNDKGSYLDEQLRLTLGAYYEPWHMLRTINEQSPIQARVPFICTLR